jgi:hypothetical protein
MALPLPSLPGAGTRRRIARYRGPMVVMVIVKPGRRHQVSLKPQGRYANNACECGCARACTCACSILVRRSSTWCAVVALAVCTRGRINLLQREEGAAGARPPRRHEWGGHARPAKRPARRRQPSGKRGREARSGKGMVRHHAQHRLSPGEAHRDSKCPAYPQPVH